MTTSNTRALIGALAAVCAVTALPAAPAHACGGLFCNSNTPVNQAAERIIFANREDGTVTAVVQIQYQGEADEFSWLLPVPGIPTVEVSSDLAFDRLQNVTNPFYSLVNEVEGTCLEDDFAVAEEAPNDTPNNNPNNTPNNDGGVTVVASGAVGPYDFEVISVDPELQDAAEVAVQWLDDNGYDVTAIGPDVLRPYLEEGMNLIGFRLQKDASSGSIRPVVLTYDSEDPMIPIRPTAVAANDNMGVMAFVLAPARAIPSNYRHLVLNDAALNWFNPNANYGTVINQAADEAGGHGFVTEFAGGSAQFEETIFTTGDELRATVILQETDWTERESELLNEIADVYGAWDGYTETLQEAVPLPEGVRFDEFAECPGCFYRDQADIEGLEVAALLQAVEDNIVEPMRRTQALFGELPYMTRLFTTLSAIEMDVDPVFEFNADLPDHDNNHSATRVIECSPEVSRFEAPWRVDFGDGVVVRGQGMVWPVSTEDMPANAQIEQLDTEGGAEVIQDNTEAIVQALSTSNERFPSGNGGGSTTDGCACTTVQRPAGGPWALGLGLWALGIVLLRRRVRT